MAAIDRSSDSASSRRFRSCITCWLLSGLFQKSGAAISFSSSSNWRRLAGASKIAPHSVGLLAERHVITLEFVESHSKPSLARRAGTKPARRFKS
jgi:hypothetical protein